MPTSAPTPAAASGDESETLRSTCSRESWRGDPADALLAEGLDQLDQAALDDRVGDLRDQLGGGIVHADVAGAPRPEAVGVPVALDRGHDRVADRAQYRAL